jgi:RNA polymerase sigma-70 factor (ECF subfamily)
LEEEGEEKIHWLLSESHDNLEQQIEREDLSRSVRALIERLPPQYRMVLTLFYQNRARYEEIAEIMEIPLGTVKTHLHRSRMRLRDLLLAESDLVGLVHDSGGETVSNGGSSS